ncbi:MAG: hypothetical protein ACKVT1_02720 [Dehalococcoidia bacterium]
MTLFIEAIHTVKPLTNTAFDTYVDWYGESVIPALKRNGYDVIGAWKRTGGAMGQDVLLIRFENATAYEKAGQSLRADTEMAKSMASWAGKFSLSESAKMGVPVPYATEQRLQKALTAKPAKPRQYMQAILNVRSGGQLKFYDVVGRLSDMTDSGEAINLVTAYETTVGQRGEATDIWVMPGGLFPLDYRPGDALADLMRDLREVAPEESTYFLNPLPYSPLQ